MTEKNKREKTSLCKYYLDGWCQSGSKCTYAHGKRDLKELKATLPCRYYQEGHCYKGYECKFLHVTTKTGSAAPAKAAAEEQVLTEAEEKRAEYLQNNVICEFIKQNLHCTAGFRCHDLHHASERRLLPPVSSSS